MSFALKSAAAGSPVTRRDGEARLGYCYGRQAPSDIAWGKPFGWP